MNEVAPIPVPVTAKQIKPIDSKEFGRGAELKDKLMAILRDVPTLHERLKKAVESVEKANEELKAATEKATAIVNEWEKVNKERA
jgi:formate dehydrogenase maturation protein FdhE